MLSSCLNSNNKRACQMPRGASTRRPRVEAGHTNRWRLAPPMASDLLGQAQMHRATRPDVSPSYWSARSGELHRRPEMSVTLLADALSACDVTSSPDSRLPPTMAATAASRDCHSSRIQRSPEESFYVSSQQVVQNAKPDVVLECLGSVWEMHWPFLSRSHTLAELFINSKMRRDALLQDKAGGRTRRWERRMREDRGVAKNQGSLIGPVLLQLPIHDSSISKEHLSFALRTLYRPDECPDQWGGAVLSVAALLSLPQLFQRCLIGMMADITAATVCDFHRVSCKYKQPSLQGACERWLELFLVSELSCHIHLKDLPFDLLLKTLQSPRLFVLSEYDLLKTVLYWIYLQLHTTEQAAPSHWTVISFFCRAKGVFLEQPLGRVYAPLFQSLRLHGITERQHVEEMQMIGVFPWSKLLSFLNDHYCSIHSGGDMHVTDLCKQSVRFGLVVDGEADPCTRAIGLYGFYFLLRASRVGESDSFCFSMERLRYWDLVVTEFCRATQPFSMRAERSVCYQISVQSRVCGEWQEHSSGTISHVLGLSKRYSRSKVFKVDGLSTPILVTFALAFPSPQSHDVITVTP
ncbi:BTB/POZ domain-containing protein 16 isoform X4 [Brachyhypopomus gauderio]|uniref:BTB/POZ domain-containing protein 16 isoform X4 n=1 Tax=Brachyhypopomus gauderio TaxID=698409 RepID=UPI004042BB4A